MRGGAGRGGDDRGGGGDGLVDDDRALGQQGGDGGADRARVERARGQPGRAARPRRAPSAEAPRASASASSAPATSSRGPASACHVGLGVREPARAAGVGEERHRRLRAADDEVAQPGQRLGGHLGQVGEGLRARDPGAALEPARERVVDQTGAGGRGDPSRRAQRGPARGGAAQQQGRGPPGAQRAGRGLDRALRDRGRRRDRQRGGRAGARLPAGVGRHDERGDLAAVAAGRGHGLGGVGRGGAGVAGARVPVRDRPRDRRDVARQRRVERERACTAWSPTTLTIGVRAL